VAVAGTGVRVGRGVAVSGGGDVGSVVAVGSGSVVAVAGGSVG